MKTKKRPSIVSVHLSSESKEQLNAVCAERGMTIKLLLGRLIAWFVELDRTEQSIVLGQVEPDDMRSLAELVLERRRSRTRKRAGRATSRNTSRRR